MGKTIALSRRSTAEKITRLALMLSLCGAWVTAPAALPQSLAPQAGTLQNLLDTSRDGLFSLLRGETEPALIEKTKEAARQAMTLIEAGQLTTSRQQQNDAMGWLHFTLGAAAVHKKEYVDAARHLRLAAALNGGARKDPRVYKLLAQAYEEGEYQKLAEPFRGYHVGPETPEMKAQMKQVERMIDLITDAYARAVALYGGELGWQQEKVKTRRKLEGFYEYRRGGSAAGLDEFIKESLARPLPAP